MTSRDHWEAVYKEKAPNEVSWFRSHLEKSVQLIEEAARERDAAIIDVGGGESTLVDDLLKLGYPHVSVLDISRVAIRETRQRLGAAAESVEWLVADITQVTLPEQRYDVWHDRAVFHFLVESEQRTAYVRQVRRSLVPGGHLVMAVFGPDGPRRCSGLNVVRHGIELLSQHLGPDFELVSDSLGEHQTPGGKTQQFLYAHFRLRHAQS